MSTYELALKRRSIRRFKNVAIPYEILEKCVNAARLAPSGGNLQPLEFIIVDDEQLLAKMFDTKLNWAGAIKPEGHVPPPGQRPMAYIVVLIKTGVADENAEAWEKGNVGLAVENMILVALEEGIGSCCIGGFEPEKLKPLLNIPNDYNISLVIALGYPDENPIVDEFDKSGPYWQRIRRDKDNAIHVPKRKLTDILHRNKF